MARRPSATISGIVRAILEIRNEELGIRKFASGSGTVATDKAMGHDALKSYIPDSNFLIHNCENQA